jgi:putative flavoprotein involved in K+ transport
LNQDVSDVAIVGAGQAGLAVAYCLKQRGIDPILVDAAPSIGTSWRERYDSLTLFTPSQYSNLPGMPFPAPADHYPSKDEVADYLERYASTFDLKVRTGTKVKRLSHKSGHFLLDCDKGSISAKAAIAATGALQAPKIPAFASNIDQSVRQLHSADYRNPEMIPPGDILVVGGGNSGAQIAEELAKVDRKVSVSVENWPRHLPQRFLGTDIFWWLTKAGLISTKPAKIVGSRASTPIPTIGTNLRALDRAKVISRVGRVIDADRHEVILADQTRLKPSTIIWATGFENDFSWIDIEGATNGKAPLHHRGVSPVAGLFYIGLPFLHSKGSAFLGFVEEDAQFVASAVTHHLSVQGRREVTHSEDFMVATSA